MMVTAKRRWALLLAALSLVAAACGGGGPAASPAEDDPTAGQPAETKSVKLAFPTGKTSFANCDVGVGIDQGFFSEEGLEFETENLGSGLKVVQALVSNEFDIGGASIEPVINAVAKGQSLSVIGTYADRLTVSMMVPEEVQAVEDLQGKILGIQDVGAFREVMTRMVLESAGLGPQDVNYRGVETTGYIGALIAGQIQSAILHAEQVEDILTKDPSFHSILDLYEVEPNYFYGTYFVDDGWLEQNRDVAEGFIRALVKSHRFMYDNREETVRICAEVTGFDEGIVDQAWERYFEKNLVFPRNSGLDEERINYTIDRMEDLDTLAEGEKPQASAFVNHEFMDTVIAELGEAPERSE